MTQQNLLPKFGPAKRMEERDDEAELAAEAGEELPQENGSAPEKMAPAQPNSITSMEAGAPVASDTPVNAVRERIFQKGWRRLRGLFQRRSTLSSTATAVQEEFVLDLVQVVRNDLSDTDLLLKPAARPAEKPALATAHETPAARPASIPEENRSGGRMFWGRVSRVFGARGAVH